MKTSIHVWHLEMTSRPAPDIPGMRPYQLLKAEAPVPEFSRFLYTAVGSSCKWYMRLTWDWQRWYDYLHRPGLDTWVACIGGSPIGYFELESQPQGSVEIVLFGLVPEFVGRGLGRSFLQDAIDQAWAVAGKRVWLHTCSLDHPNALPNYLNRGFSIFKEEDFEDMVPVVPLQPWPDARKKLGSP